MEATLVSFPSSKPPPSETLIRFRPANPLLLSKPNFRANSLGVRPISIKSAISRTKKEQTVETVKTQLENCYLLAAIKYAGFTVNQFQELRRSLPESSKLMVAKNSLVYKAIEGTPWEVLKPCMKGMNAWLFVHTEEIPEAIKPYRSFQREKKKLDTNDFTGAVFEGRFYGPGDFKQLETMPTRSETYAKILGSLQGPAIGLVGTLQAPARDVVLVLRAFVSKLEEESGRQ
uniref:Large ribosomal subunit protein uL10c n=1 Tax=Rhizophora mucronata TaxID=61149 RepID=A0A2P2K061_RHIMU